MSTKNADWDFPINRSYFPDDVWFRGAPKKTPTIVREATPAHDDELAGWIGHAAYWESRALKAEFEVERLQRLLSAPRRTVRQFSGITEVAST